MVMNLIYDEAVKNTLSLLSFDVFPATTFTNLQINNIFQNKSDEFENNLSFPFERL